MTKIGETVLSFHGANVDSMRGHIEALGIDYQDLLEESSVQARMSLEIIRDGMVAGDDPIVPVATALCADFMLGVVVGVKHALAGLVTPKETL